MTTPSFDFVVIYVSDLDATYRFFTDTLGFVPLSDEDATSPNFRQLHGEGGIDFGLIVSGEGDRGKPGDIDIYIKTDDIHALREAIISKGVAAGPVVDRPFGQVVPMPAPDGLRVVALGNPA